MTGLNYFQGNFEESREATEYREDEDDAAMRYELGDGEGATPGPGDTFSEFNKTKNVGVHCWPGSNAPGKTAPGATHFTPTNTTARALRANGALSSAVNTDVDCKRHCDEESQCKCMSYMKSTKQCVLHASCDLKNCCTNTTGCPWAAKWTTYTKGDVPDCKSSYRPYGGWCRSRDADGAVSDQIGSVVGHAEWATKTLARQAQLRALDSCHVAETHCHELKNTTRIRQTPNATLDLPYSSHSATETPVNHGGNVTHDASESGCLTQITAYSKNLRKLLRSKSTCTSCNASKAFVPLNMLDKAGRCLDFTPKMTSYCTQLDRVGWTAAIGLRHVLCTKYGLAWTDFAVYKMSPGPAKDHFIGGELNIPGYVDKEFRKAQCSLVKYTACRFNSGTNSTACINKKTVKCVTVCHAGNPAHGEATTSVANSKGCNATMCEGKYGSLACQQLAMQA